MRQHHFFTSDLSVNEFLLVKEVGFQPLGLVMGSSIFHVGFHPVRGISEAELAERRKSWKAPAPRYKTGYLAKYTAMATSAATGAVLKWD
jgi:hypothetical protein